ncbi:MAG: L,D-transpeptidase family protein [Candidatus Omnitrophota bacterium]|nr:L,D-transpeptidase family protein [Candidatus Omnitrophota bacterium]
MRRIVTIGLIAAAIIGIIVISMVLAFRSKGQEQASSGPYLKEAEIASAQGNYIEAKNIYKKALEATDDVNKLKEIQKKIEEINIKIIFSPAMDKCSTKYTVKPGDILAKIAKEFNTTVELVKRANSLNSDVIRPEQQLKINTCKFSIAVDKSQNLLFLKTGDEVVKTYIVSTGKDNSTPVGSFKIVNKQPNPTWFKTGAVIPPNSPENILGTRWLGLDAKGYGIHGTTEPQNLGKQVTMGCVRMKDEEVEQLYDIIPVGTEVTIID